MISISLIGKTFGRLTVLDRAGSSKNGHSIWLCLCECGVTANVLGTNLRTGHTTSCGCYNTEVVTKHNQYGSLTYQSWKGMIQRCINPKSSKYKDYGGRGITVCSKWMESFISFVNDMGIRPGKQFTIDRIDNDKGYYKNNCRWATRLQQNLNKRKKNNIDDTNNRIRSQRVC